MTYYAECITFKENDKQRDHQDKKKQDLDLNYNTSASITYFHTICIFSL